MANVFRQFLLDAEHGDVEAVQRNIGNGINLEARDEVRREGDNDNWLFFQYRINKQR